MPKRFDAKVYEDKDSIRASFKVPSKYAPLIEEILKEEATNLSHLTGDVMKGFLEKELKKRKK